MNRIALNNLLNVVDDISSHLVGIEGTRYALGSLYELRLMLVAEGIVKSDQLPPMRDPTTGDPKTTTRVKSIDVPCPSCGAKPRQGCFRMTKRGVNGEPTDQPLLDGEGKRQFHHKRYDAAKRRSGR